uniref:NADH-ubiquinone oxidoreductase chain 6 n=1 Tax=Curculionoidea sp. 3 KM-2017 TaxID=2219414 RepID=A0A346RJV9_9CUCU|nr:NADH dehydrogenase subunit 6 [Curculionoidea sp. 3 KM-2017]
MYLFMLNWIFSMIFLFLNHPLSLGSILLLQTISISLLSGMFYMNFWFSYILFLIMVGGMLVMFLYMTSIASNEKFKLPKMMILFIMIFMIIFMLLTLFSDKFFSNPILMTMTNSNQSIMMYNNFNLNKFFNFPNMQLMIMIMIYLLITLIAIVKIIGKNLGTLRQK